MFVLPVSGTPVVLRAPDGHDDMRVAEHASGDWMLRVELVRRLAPPARPDSDWGALPFADVDAALLALRQFLTSDRIVAEIRCATCGEWGDLQLSIGAYLDAKRPRPIHGAATLPIPTVDDVLTAVQTHRPEAAAAALEAAYLAKCGDEKPRRALARLERAAPPLAGAVEGTCPHCGAAVEAWFDPGAFVIDELRARAATLFEEVHLLASRYGWSEDTILTLPASRRAAYAELIADERSAP